MRVIEISKYGPPQVLISAQRPVPVPAVGEILIKIHAAGINRPDVLQRLGHYPPPAGVTDIPGLEVAGEVVAGDLSGGSLKIGDMVCALLAGGGYAEYCVAPAALCLPVPAGWSAVEAASLPEALFTVWSNVFDRGGLQSGETLLVQGGASGIGVTAIQLAHTLGHRVFATAGSDDKCRRCEALGAERAINYRDEDFVEVVRQMTEGRGADVILDMVAGDYLGREINCLADDGRLVIIALLGGSKGQIDAGQVLRRRLTITGSTLRARPTVFKAAIAARLRSRVWPLFESRAIQPVIHEVFALEDAWKAHALMESGTHVGKIVLQVV